MRFIALADTMDWRSKRMDVLHKQLFHGDAIRADAPANPTEWGPGTWSHYIGDDLSQPLLLIRSGVYIPPVFNPGVALVVRAEVHSQLAKYTDLQFADARPSKLINCWAPIGDFRFYDTIYPVYRKRGCLPDMLLDWMPNDPSLFDDFPECYEVVSYNLNSPSDTSGRAESSVSFVMNNDRETEVNFNYNKSILDKYAMLWSSVFLCRRDLFDLLQQYLDKNHFAIREVDL